MTLWSVKIPVPFPDNMSVTLTRFGTLVITRYSMLFFIEVSRGGR